ncbi:toll/interleukin-1 receptor domain-containing protein [Anaerobaca lacustris]|uniref:Toll/interleukin-1 receptor domain-containing protein n=1 Tax=Anaerobaca lacustris TaxID=3044600 RepID=A0AAW6U596_9BACT|nr:toll/interleukin-1 receptor domain-containing protein [Sedimentisphaerales bacterium M17dextr]
MAAAFQYDVFLSHSRKDKPIVREPGKHLKTDGLKVWVEERETRLGDSIPARIEEHI